MGFARKAWHLLVAIKDGLALLFLLLFFALLFAILTARPSPAQIQEGALLLELDGVIVEEAAEIDPFEALLTGVEPIGEYQARDLVRAIDAAATDERIEAVVLDLTYFLGGGQVHLSEIGAALDRVRAADKPVLAYAIGYADDHMMLAAHASEVWLDPLGGAFIAGPGGERLYYANLLENLKVNARVYRVGEYKSAVEPFTRADMSPEARENYAALYAALWEEWQANVSRARPNIRLDRVTRTPVEWVEAAEGDLATAALEARLVDRLGSRAEFGKRVAEIVGEDPWDDLPGNFAATPLDIWLTDVDVPDDGAAIAVVTVAGEIVDGETGPGTAGGDRIAALLDEALAEEPAGLVVRVDSPGGSVLASEAIRQAVMRHEARGVPIAVSMANVAASGGYWIATPADRVFAEPETITGSIGIFGIVPTFERTAAEIGVTTDGVRTTPLSGQPDLIAGFTPETDAILQASIEDGYRDFIERVAAARNMSPAQVDRIGQGRVWDGGTARQIGLVDQFGGLDDALEWVAGEAELGDDWHAWHLGDDADAFDTLLSAMLAGDARARGPSGGDLFAVLARREAALAGTIAADLDRLLTTRGAQAYCLECPASARDAAAAETRATGLLPLLARWFTG